MKNYYLLLVFFITLFSFNTIQAQFCPPNGFTNSFSLFFIYDAGTIPCVDRPNTVTVDGSIFMMIDCNDTNSIYDLTTGPPVSNINNFVADFGVGTCEYTNGDLTDETLSIDETSTTISDTRIFPNPLLHDNSLYLIFGYKINAKITVYNVAGKFIMSDEIEYLNRKELNVEQLPNGIYFLKINTNQTSITRKVIVMK